MKVSEHCYQSNTRWKIEWRSCERKGLHEQNGDESFITYKYHIYCNIGNISMSIEYKV